MNASNVTLIGKFNVGHGVSAISVVPQKESFATDCFWVGEDAL
jgi:hypothetical protein